MHDFQRKKRIKKILYSPVVLLLLAIIFIIMLRGVWSVYKKSQISLENLEREKIELSKLIERQKNLANSIDYLKTEQGIEDEIRTKFRVVKEGEHVAVIIKEEVPKVSTEQASSSGFWYRLFHWSR